MPLTKTQASIGIIIVILFLAVMPFNLHLGGIPYLDKMLHATASGVLTFALLQFMSIRRAVLLAFILITGAEVLQFFTPRDADHKDVIANCLGIGYVWIMYTMFARTKGDKNV